jgi:hypothetical protein
MNIVFWIFVILAAVGVWYVCAPLFNHIGNAAKYVAEEISEEMKGENDEK